LDKQGYDGMEAGIKLNFGPEEMAEYNIADLFAAFDRKAISQKELRHILSTYMKWDISGEGPTIPEEKIPSNATQASNATGKQPMKIPLAPAQTQQKMATVFGESGETKIRVNKPTMIESKIVPQAPQTIIEYVELPEGIAGYNTDFSKIYIDPLVQVECVKSGLEYSLIESLIIAHETFEYQALRAGKSWTEAHRLATQFERTIARDKGIDWEKYNNMYLGLLSKIKDRHSIGPSDLVFQGKGIVI
jgi:hypothetical protein